MEVETYRLEQLACMIGGLMLLIVFVGSNVAWVGPAIHPIRGYLFAGGVALLAVGIIGLAIS